MITIREARELHVEAIRDLFLAAYGADYAYTEDYDLQVLKIVLYRNLAASLGAKLLRLDRSMPDRPSPA